MKLFTSRILVFALMAMVITAGAAPRPNIILAMADDMGWGDPGYNSTNVIYAATGLPHPDQGWISTPTMDDMAATGLRFDRFYSASAVCSPTRASCLTGRNPFRVGVPNANSGRLGFDETPLSEVLSAAGYLCGHIGKWHLGSLTTLRADSNRGGNASVYSGPWHHSYDFCFATESKVPTYHPYRKTNNGLALPADFSDPNFYGTRYWRMPATWNQTSGEGAAVAVIEVNDATDGDDSKLMIDQAIPFIQDAVSQGKPFFLVLWFHTPHKPVVDPDQVSGVDSSDAGRDSIQDLDTALGRVRAELTTLGVRSNTMFWVTSDNGPENGVDSFNETSSTRSIRSGRLLERKRSLHEGGVRVPGILEWPDVITTGMTTDLPAITSDYYPTILDYLELSVPNQKPLDGISLRPVIERTATTRGKPIGFKYSGDKSWMNHQYKLINDGSGWELYDLINIAAGEEVEQTAAATAANIGSQPQAIQEVYHTMLAEYTAWDATVGSDTPYIHASQPTVVLSTTSGTASSPFTVTAAFSKEITQLNANEFVVANGIASGLAGSGTNWTVTISPFSDGAVTVILPEGCVIDSDGNINAGSSQIEVTYSNPSAPGVTLTTPDNPVSTNFIVTATFTEEVTGLEASDFDVNPGTATNLLGGPSVYTVEVVPAGAGTISVFLPGGVAQDGATNYNNASNLLNVDYAPPVPPAPPVWQDDPIEFSGTVDTAFTGSLAGKAIDPNYEDVVSYSRDPSGPAWLNVSTNGLLTGTPTTLGTNTFTVWADDGNTTNSSAVLNIMVLAPSLGTIISNGDLDSAVTPHGSGAGNTVYSLDILTGIVQENGSDTAVSENEWLISTLSRGFEYSATGGNGGGGAFVQNAANDFNEKPRAVLQFVNNGKTTTGVVEIKMDVNFDDNAGGLLFNVELFGWNRADTGPGLSVGGGDPNIITYNDTILNDATLLLNVPLAASDFADATWSTATVSNSFDLGTGYDYYAWRIGVVGASVGDAFAFDNVTVISPAGPVQDLTLSGGTPLILAWTGESNGTYSVQTNSDLVSGSWGTSQSGITGTGGAVTITNTIGADQTFYRVITD